MIRSKKDSQISHTRQHFPNFKHKVTSNTSFLVTTFFICLSYQHIYTLGHSFHYNRPRNTFSLKPQGYEKYGLINNHGLSLTYPGGNYPLFSSINDNSEGDVEPTTYETGSSSDDYSDYRAESNYPNEDSTLVESEEPAPWQKMPDFSVLNKPEKKFKSGQDSNNLVNQYIDQNQLFETIPVKKSTKRMDPIEAKFLHHFRPFVGVPAVSQVVSQGTSSNAQSTQQNIEPSTPNRKPSQNIFQDRSQETPVLPSLSASSSSSNPNSGNINDEIATDSVSNVNAEVVSTEEQQKQREKKKQRDEEQQVVEQPVKKHKQHRIQRDTKRRDHRINLINKWRHLRRLRRLRENQRRALAYHYGKRGVIRQKPTAEQIRQLHANSLSGKLPKDFAFQSIGELRAYLRALNEWLAITGRPRKSIDDKVEFFSYLLPITNKYLSTRKEEAVKARAYYLTKSIILKLIDLIFMSEDKKTDKYHPYSSGNNYKLKHNVSPNKIWRWLKSNDLSQNKDIANYPPIVEDNEYFLKYDSSAKRERNLIKFLVNQVFFYLKYYPKFLNSANETKYDRLIRLITSLKNEYLPERKWLTMDDIVDEILKLYSTLTKEDLKYDRKNIELDLPSSNEKLNWLNYLISTKMKKSSENNQAWLENATKDIDLKDYLFNDEKEHFSNFIDRKVKAVSKHDSILKNKIGSIQSRSQNKKQNLNFLAESSNKYRTKESEKSSKRKMSLSHIVNLLKNKLKTTKKIEAHRRKEAPATVTTYLLSWL